MTRKFVKVVYQKNQRFDEEYELWEKLSSHSGRHTFSMLMLDLKVDITELADLMGHGSIATTMIYRTIRGEDKIWVVNNAWKNLPGFDPNLDPKK
ncbi:tyrosine-type recombinase/integrase [Larkinella bovis]|uniref:Tyrosine-type recombinase/integrase n=1 Tax=Larkinella bovis TaxID=683041 RepID=A0ABW0IGN6_9BACT